MSADSIKQGMLCKRAQGKSSLGRKNWKDRFFVLNANDLTYYEGYGGPSNPDAKRCGGILLNTVKTVEPVVDGTFSGKNNVFQIIYDEYVLYCQAKDNEEMLSWVNEIRAKIYMNNCLIAKYHSGAFVSGKWSCCTAKGKNAEGCCAAFDYTTIGGSKPQLRDANDPLPPPGQPAVQQQQQQAVADVSSRPLPQPPTPQQSEPAQPASQEPFLFEVIATYPFTSSESSDLSIEANERLVVIEQTQLHWWKAKKADGSVGFIPSNYVRKLGMESEPWFLGKISRSEATAMLQMAKSEGCFLVRESESKPGQYSLSVSHKEGFRHYHIREEGSEFYINERHKFGDICQLIEYHQLNSGGLITRLRKPVSNANAPVAPGLGHDKWEIDANDILMQEELGSGQFGVVMKGVYKGTRDVAVKMMKEGSMSEDDFISEAQVMKEFHHKNLVELYGVCTTRPLKIVTEFMCNGCLLNYIRDHQELADQLEVVHFMGVQVAAAMCFLESRLFIHRDLAARNCLIGENYIVKVADFGLARFTLDDEYTASEGTKFPIKWAAPEVFNYARFSTKSDVWAFGILLWELWSLGVTPYPSMSNAQVINKVAEGYRMDKPRFASEQVFAVMKDAWHQDPESRPSFAEIQQRLEENKPEYG